jgi:hypothetical protein
MCRALFSFRKLLSFTDTSIEYIAHHVGTPFEYLPAALI